MAVDLLWQIWCENEAFNHSSKLGGWTLHFRTSLNRHDCHQSKNMKNVFNVFSLPMVKHVGLPWFKSRNAKCA